MQQAGQAGVLDLLPDFPGFFYELRGNRAIVSPTLDASGTQR